MLVPLILLALCCVIGAAVFYLIWTASDNTGMHDIPWTPPDTVDFTKYPIVPGHDWTGLA
jgi:hypothetical protein